jgi:hypothetical protein
MDKLAFVAWARVRCPYCGGALTWAPDHWLAAHEEVFDCVRCGRFSDFDRAFTDRHSGDASRLRGQITGTKDPSAISRRRKAITVT